MAGKKLTKVSLSELFKRVPSNQVDKFLQFRDQNTAYKKRVAKYPEFLPRIDWDYYKANVRTDYVKMVEEFRVKYEELNKVFDARSKLDTSKYFVELEKLREEVKEDIEEFVCESNERIECLQEEIERIRNMVPFDQMTVEEFLELCPEKSENYPSIEKPSFWPHIPEEQTPGPGVIHVPEDDSTASPVQKDSKKAAKPLKKEELDKNDVIEDKKVKSEQKTKVAASSKEVKKVELEEKKDKSKEKVVTASSKEVKKVDNKDDKPKTSQKPETPPPKSNDDKNKKK